jgi:V-type H+-transporting ATPase subunit D
MKIKQKGAQKGHSLLKRKSDALTVRFRNILARIRAAKHEMSDLMRVASLAMAQVNYAAGDISVAVRESVVGAADFQVRTRMENVSGVQLPVFEAFLTSSAPGTASASTSSAGTVQALELTALSRGGQQVQKCRETFQRVLQSLLQLASLQTSFYILDAVIRTTNRRVNALEYVLLPKTENTITYISGELDEQDREEFFRLKKVQSKKKERAARAEAEAENEDEEDDEEGNGDESREPPGGNVNDTADLVEAVNLLDLDKDPDLIF